MSDSSWGSGPWRQGEDSSRAVAGDRRRTAARTASPSPKRVVEMVPEQLPAVDVTIDLRPVLVSGVFPPAPRRRPLALVVEDDDDTRDLMAGILERDGIDVLCAADRASALDVLAHWPVDVVTLDIGLPDGDGLEVCSAIRSRGQRPDVPVLAVTARATFEAELRSFMSGVDDYVVKPVSAAGLVRRVRGLL